MERARIHADEILTITSTITETWNFYTAHGALMGFHLM